MNLPTISLSSLPGLESTTALFGSAGNVASTCCDDSIILLMVFIYELIPPDASMGLLSL